MSAFLPPDSRWLQRRIIRRNARRAARVARDLAPLAGRPGPASGMYPGCEAVRALAETLRSLRGAPRAELLWAPEMRAWLCQAEEAIQFARARRAPRRLFELAAGGEHLALLTPSGKLDDTIVPRAGRLIDRMLAAALRELPFVLTGFTPHGATFGPFTAHGLADGGRARLAGELHLRIPGLITLRLPSRARLMLVPGGIGVISSGAKLAERPRQVIPGTGIVVSRRARSSRRGLTPGAQVPGLPERLGAALELLGEAWPAARAEVLAHTREVVPLMERGTVSYSLRARPGVSYINVWGKSLVDLADDLLHETAHHRLHGLEELVVLHRDDGDPLYWSPWRRSQRPLQGILHAAYTFTWRAALMGRLLDLPARRRSGVRRSWLASQLQIEREALRRSAADLADASRRGLLTPDGRRLVSALARRQREIA